LFLVSGIWSHLSGLMYGALTGAFLLPPAWRETCDPSPETRHLTPGLATFLPAVHLTKVLEFIGIYMVAFSASAVRRS